jgi:hypothetical protein
VKKVVPDTTKGSHFLVERTLPGHLLGVVAFRAAGTQLYLTNIVYGNHRRQTLAKILARIPARLQPATIALIVDFTIDRPTDEMFLEGPGFNYSPMALQQGTPNRLQLFRLETPVPDDGRLGVRSLFGTYLLAVSALEQYDFARTSLSR